MKKISILGATGSVGTNTLEIISRNKTKYKVIALTSFKNFKKLAKLALDFNCSYAVIGDKYYYKALKKELSGTRVTCLAGSEGITEIAKIKVDIMISAIVGIAGLMPTFYSIGNSKLLAIANKESIISAGSILLNKAKRMDTKIIPLDSEHNAIFQLLNKEQNKSIRNIILTASGGPFLNMKIKDFKNICVNQALSHPNWKMGKKITIDSATLVNKVLETVEASILFGIDLDLVDIIIHPSSLVHGIVNFIDGSSHFIASKPDMQIPINYALTWPQRSPNKVKFINFKKNNEFSFFTPNARKFPALTLKNIIRNSKFKKSSIIVLNASNEIAVESFLKNNIEFNDIVKVIKKTIKTFEHINVKSLRDVLLVDSEARKRASNIISKKI